MQPIRPRKRPLSPHSIVRRTALGTAFLALATAFVPALAATRLAPRAAQFATPQAQQSAANRIPTIAPAATPSHAALAIGSADAVASEFAVADSTSAAGPAFEFASLTRSNARTVVSGSSRIATVELAGPGFPLGSSTVRSLQVSTDGFLSTATDETGYDATKGWTPSSGVRIVALGVAMRGSVSHAYDAAEGANVFQWRGKATATGVAVRFQAKLFDDGRILFLFDRIGDSASAFTGIASADASVAGRSYSHRKAGDNVAVSFAAKGAERGGCPSTLTHSSSTAITPLNSVSCNDGVGHTDNSYWRAFNLTAFGATGTYNVTSVDVGIEDATSGGSGRVTAGQSITVNIYSSSTSFPTGFPGSLTLAGTATTTVADQSGTILNVPITAAVDTASELVLEVHTPNGETAGNLFFIGSNSATETGPSYLSAPDCGITAPTATSAIGFPEMHVVMAVNGSCAGSCEVTCPADVTVSNDPNQCGAVVNYPPPTTSGNCGTVSCSPASGSFFPVGTTTVTCSESGGSSCSFTVTVVDTQAPVITAPANVTRSNDPNQCGAVVTYTQPSVADNCSSATVACSPASGSYFSKGTTTVTCTATDKYKNSSSCTFTVAVDDTQAPVLASHANVTAPAATVQGTTLGAFVTFAAPSATDNCSAATVTCSPASGSFFPVGTTTVTCTAKDAVNNSSTSAFTVTVGSAFTNCYFDDATGNVISIVTTPSSPLYRFWQMRIVATGQVLQGNAEYLSYTPGRSCIAYDHDTTQVRMDLNASYSSRTATATVTNIPANRQYMLRDRNINDDPACH